MRVLFSRPWVAAACLLLLAAGLMFAPEFSGWVTSTLNLTINIASQDKACLYFVDGFSPYVIQDAPRNISAEIGNCGSTILQGEAVMEIRNSSNEVVEYINSSNYTLYPSQYYIFSTQWTPVHELGEYVVYLRDNEYGLGSTNEINQSFNISCSIGTFKCFGRELRYCKDTVAWEHYLTCSALCENGKCVYPQGGEAAAGGGGFAAQGDIRLEYESDITVSRGSNYTLVVRIENNGSGYLYNLRFEAASDTLKLYYPELPVDRVPPNSSVLLLLTIDAGDASSGLHRVAITARSASVYRSGAIDVRIVGELAEDESCRSMISRYLDIAGYLDEEIKTLELRGFNVSEARRALDEALTEVEIARGFEKLGMYRSCSEKEGAIRKRFERVLEIITVIVSGKKEGPLEAGPGIQWWLFYLALGIALGIALVAAAARMLRDYYRKRRIMRVRGW